MTAETRDLYCSSSGDRWVLVRDGDLRVFVRHEANEPSGGKVTDMDIGQFLTTGGTGPETRELLRLIGSLVERNEETTPEFIATTDLNASNDG
ncbi:hypothetical protein FHS85_004149 [Rhodoligotrophos appendicifer]|uniref:hypothetical protein n=1 Tax=Rhodoligotrophos appendicifer TaxID=987056 RepID=UPI0019613AC4|nr:hypothetical protein [Rhodoligotrophos appendicifer]